MEIHESHEMMREKQNSRILNRKEGSDVSIYLSVDFPLNGVWHAPACKNKHSVESWLTLCF